MSIQRPNTGDAAAPRAALEEALTLAIDRRAESFVRLRRRMHATPESSGEERETTQLVAETLQEIGLEPHVMADGVGVIAEIDLGATGRSLIAIRSELDCVQVNDDKQVPYSSTHAGLCHACGHDVHTTTSLALAAAFKDCADEIDRSTFDHNLRLIFQPAEETATGARSMISQGALNSVEAILALHVDPFLEPGRIGIRNGPLTSAFKAFRVTVRGRGGHSARPFEAIDPIPAATGVVSHFYQLGPRSMDSRYPLALTVGSIQSGSLFNAIPDTAVITGTLRAARLVDVEAVQKRMQAVVDGMAEATGCEIDLDIIHACPATDNDPALVSVIARAAEEVLGPDAVEWLEVGSLGGEDFAFYQELIPGAMFKLGSAMEDSRLRRPLHSSLFDIDERAIADGAKLMAVCASRAASQE